MNNKDIINIFYSLLERQDNDSLRQCSIYLNKIIGPKYFKNINVNSNKITNYKFRYFVHKYNLSINVIRVKNIFELTYLNSHKVKSIIFNNGFNYDYYNYFLLQ